MGVYIGLGGSSRLPSGYQEAEYIQSSGSQYIDTGITPTNNTKLEAKMGGWTESGSHQMFGARYAFWSANGRGFAIITDAYQFNYDSGVSHGMTDGQDHELEFGQDGLYVDGTLKASITTQTFTAPCTLTLFCLNQNGSKGEYASLKYYYVKLYENSVLVRDFVPCYRTSDDEIGLYDLVNDVFYANSGSGTFTKGTDVTTQDYAELYYATIGDGTAPTPPTPTPGWEPGPNTVAYFPLTSTTTYHDQTSNENDLDGGSATYGTYQGIDCAIFTRSDYIYGTVAGNIFSTDPRTFSCWCYLNSISGEGDIFGGGRNATHQAFQLYYSDGNIGVRTYYDDATVSGVSPYLGRWINLVGTYDGNGHVIAYVNGTQIASSNITIDTYSSDVYIGKFLTNGMIGGVSNAIIEDVAWSASEIADYFDATKADYGIS